MEEKDNKTEGNEDTSKQEDGSMIGYKIDADLKKDLYEYLNGRPMLEVEHIITSMFETDDPDPFYSLEGIRMLTNYLQGTCPRKEAKPFIARMAKGVSKFALKPKVGGDPDAK